MIRFRKKIILSNVLILTLFIAVIFPLVQWSVNWISQKHLDRPPLAQQLRRALSIEAITDILEMHVSQVKRDFTIGMLIVAILLLVAISVFDILIIQYISRPIHWMIRAILPYQEGREEFIPKIRIEKSMRTLEFHKLAKVFNSLSEKIQMQIETLKMQKKETEGILESVREGIIATGTSARLSFVNQAACKMLGLSREELLKQSLNEIQTPLPEFSAKCHELILQALQTSETNVYHWNRKDQGVFYDLISAPLTHQNGALLVLQDKTSDYRVLEMGKDFIANASHELRTPITIIRGFAETLQDLPNISTEMLHEITEKIVRTCIRLDKLVRSLLTLTDIENLSEDRFKTIDLIPVIENSKYLLLTAHPHIKIEVKNKKNRAVVTADPDLIELAILNLLENAVKYSQGLPQIDVEIAEKANYVEVNIKDCGIGISEKDLPHIFERFFTVDKARSRKFGGAGLGLSIVKTVIEKHHGFTSVESEFGKGSTFKISLPLKF